MSERSRVQEWNKQWGDLATYNAEVARGIVHTPETDARMAEKQVRYNEWVKRGTDIPASKGEDMIG